MAVEKLDLGADVNGRDASSPPILTYTSAAPLVANTAVSITVPATARVAVFSSSVDIWVNQEAVAAVPAALINDGTAPCLNPSARRVTAGATLSIVSASNGYVSVEFYG